MSLKIRDLFLKNLPLYSVSISTPPLSSTQFLEKLLIQAVRQNSRARTAVKGTVHTLTKLF